MLTLTITETRPNLDVEFYKVGRDFIDYIQKYNDIRHRTVYGYVTSGDLLTRTSSCTFDSQIDVDTFTNDSEVQRITTINRVYNTANGIIGSQTVV